MAQDEQPPHDYVNGPKLNEPTNIDKFIDPTELKLSTINVTTINGNKDLLTNIKGLTGIQEHQTPANVHESLIKCWKRQIMKLAIGPPGTHTGHSSACVAYRHDPSLITTKLKINTPVFQRASDIGRVIHCGVVIDVNVKFTFFSAYGYTGAMAIRHRPGSHQIWYTPLIWKTNATGRPSYHRHRPQCCPPPHDIPHISERFIGKEHWIEIAGRASLWGGTDAEPICDAPGATASTIRDYIFAHPALAR